MKKDLTKNMLLVAISILFFIGSAIAAQTNLPKNAQGWTIFTPSSDSRIMYVSASGNDSTGQIYNSTSFSDSFNPSDEAAFATYAAAYANARNGYPDWILFKRGETFTQDINGSIRNGRSSTEPFVIGAYGASGNSPTIKTSAKTTALNSWLRSNVAVFGLDFYSYTRNPMDFGYISGSNVSGVSFLTMTSNAVLKNILLEGCKFRFYADGLNIQAYDGTIENLKVRRCILLDNYSGGASHAQGAFVRGFDIYFEGCVFDHNGWYSQAGSGGIGEATVFNHNIYAADFPSGIFRNNILMRASSIGSLIKSNSTKGGVGVEVDNNLYLDNEVGLSLTTESNPGDWQWENVSIINNVFSNIGRSQQTNRTLSWYLDYGGVDTGIIANNLLINQENSSLSGHGINLFDYQKDVTVSGNVIYNLQNCEGLNFDDAKGVNISGVTFQNNKIQIPTNSGYTVNAEYDLGDTVFSGNQFYSSKSDGTRFRLIGVNKTDSEWASATSDDSNITQVSFPDNTRDVDTYMGSIGGTATIEGFITAMRAQDRFSWDPRLEADAVNAWIRAGFYENPSLANPIENSIINAPANLTVVN
ncbi:hypothetical protein [uncultured Desulfosarcina sp.]|uniref:hypothetical protein n=1 Tax=uncultured Desulfosarcina sp. TaxID=218289 RepID=UPI0029C8B7C2|nr:hypothetical protein [uncultured Desulfosarcina sp.]